VGSWAGRGGASMKGAAGAKSYLFSIAMGSFRKKKEITGIFNNGPQGARRRIQAHMCRIQSVVDSEFRDKNHNPLTVC
jgi:hypothetical protein